MRFILLCEGQTECVMVPFLKRWLDAQLPRKVGVHPVPFHGWRQLVDDAPTHVDLWLTKHGNEDIIAVISLLDLYGPTIYPPSCSTIEQRCEWVTEHLQGKYPSPRYRHYCAVHETEAWLLSQPELFPADVRKAIAKYPEPEKVDDDEPPSKLLRKHYLAKTGRTYKKTVNGGDLFAKLDPEIARAKCPRLREMLDGMLDLAKAAMSRG
jgi:hypothetical protein